MTAAPLKAMSVHPAEFEQVEASEKEDEKGDDADGDHVAAPVEKVARL